MFGSIPLQLPLRFYPIYIIEFYSTINSPNICICQNVIKLFTNQLHTHKKRIYYTDFSFMKVFLQDSFLPQYIVTVNV